MTFGEKAIKFYTHLEPPEANVSDDIKILNPLKNAEISIILKTFYKKFYFDDFKRIFLIGINPGRFGGGITGIPFTDPVNLQDVLGIFNDFDKKRELSSRFIYNVVEAIGGPEKFFGRVYLTAVSPLGFVKNSKNLNYYDDQLILENWRPWFIKKLEEQLTFGARRDIAFSLGRGKNLEFLLKLNKEKKIFQHIEPLPHPRWVMQYRYKKQRDFLKIYIERINSFIFS